MKEFRNILQLRDIIIIETAIFNKEWENTVVFSASVCRVHLSQLAEYDTPSFNLLWRVVDAWDTIATVMAKRYEKELMVLVGRQKQKMAPSLIINILSEFSGVLCDKVTPFTVFGIGSTGVIRAEFFTHLRGKLVNNIRSKYMQYEFRLSFNFTCRSFPFFLFR